MTTKPFATLRRLSTLALASGLALGASACTDEDFTGNSIRPAWVQNQEFHLETSYQKIGMRTARGDTAADPAADALGDTMDLSDQWSESVYWRYQVIDQGLYPEAGEDFYEYSTKGGTESGLTIIKASLNPTLNVGTELIEADPKIYMVIREDRLRLAGMVMFSTVGGVRTSSAVTVDDGDMNRAYSRLSQANLSIIPHFIPPFPISGDVDGDRVLEDGQVVSFANATGTSVDVMYDNSMDDTLIAETWEDGQPWASYSFTPTVESRLMTNDEVDDLTGGIDFSNHDDPEDFDFVDLLRAPLNLSASLSVNELVGSSTKEAREGYRPWAGDWWSQEGGKLWLGHVSGSNNTISGMVDSTVRPIATDLQNLGDELRDIRKESGAESTEYTTKVEEYRTKQRELVDGLVEFYNAVRSGIDQNRIVVADGRVSAESSWHADYDSFDFEINRMSPLDKFALVAQLEGRTHNTNPWFGPAWEALNHWSPAGSGWFGHCNGWAAAAILTHEPREAVTVNFGSTDQHSVELSTADQKGLLSESHYSTLSNFWGQRYNGDDGDDISDLTPKATLQLLSTIIGDRGIPMVFDTTAGDQVWNFPAWKYELTLTETGSASSTTEDGSTGLININTANLEELSTLWGINTVRGNRIIQYREQNGPFQTTEEIVDVRGIGFGIYNRIKDSITVTQSTQLREFDGHLRVRFTTDGVAPSHIDSDQNNPNGFWKVWRFTLEASPNGDIISGTWDDPEDGHPDFAWIPYANSVYEGRSENPYLWWGDLEGMMPGITRE